MTMMITMYCGNGDCGCSLAVSGNLGNKGRLYIKCSNPCNYIDYGGRYHYTADQSSACGCLARRLQARVCRLSLQPIDCTSALSVTYSAAAAAVAAFGAI